MSKQLSEFTRYLNDFGARALDQLTAGRAAAEMTAGAEGAPPDVSPLDGLAAHWSALSPEEKAKFFRQAAGPRTRRVRARSKPGAAASKRSTAASKVTPAVADAKSARDVEKERRKAEKKAKKQAKKDAKAKGKLEKKLKKELKTKAKQGKKAKASDAKKTKTQSKAKKRNTKPAKKLERTARVAPGVATPE